MKHLRTLTFILFAILLGSCEQDSYILEDLEGEWLVTPYSNTGSLVTNPYEVVIEKYSKGDLLLIRNFLNLAGDKNTKQETFTAWAEVFGSQFILMEKTLDQDYIINNSIGRIQDGGRTISITYSYLFAGQPVQETAIFQRINDN